MTESSTLREESEEKRTEIKDCAREIVLLKLNTDRHEASRGLSATAELSCNVPIKGLIGFRYNFNKIYNPGCSVQ